MKLIVVVIVRILVKAMAIFTVELVQVMMWMFLAPGHFLSGCGRSVLFSLPDLAGQGGIQDELGDTPSEHGSGPRQTGEAQAKLGALIGPWPFWCYSLR
eukprot:9468441-Pyramimonas_sp.AAC.1